MAFAKVPARPITLKAAGRIINLISFVAGEVKSVKHADTIQTLPSVKKLVLDCNVGDDVSKTGSCRLYYRIYRCSSFYSHLKPIFICSCIRVHVPRILDILLLKSVIVSLFSYNTTYS